ncbi:M24 family metallopeptidase [Georgenia sp. MJ206]
MLLADPLSLSWLLGVRSSVRMGSDKPCFAVHLDARSGGLPAVHVVTPRNEAARLVEVELAEVAYSGEMGVLTHEWNEGPWSVIDTDGRLGSDMPAAGVRSIAEDIARVRRALVAPQKLELAAVTARVTRIVEATARRARVGMTERVLAAETVEALVRDGLEPLVVLVGSGTDLDRFKHPLPRDVPIGGRFMVSVGARGAGVVTSVTRYGTFDGLTAREADEYRRLQEVEAVLLRSSTPGARLGAALDAGKAAYRTHGFPAETWREHHQGGIAGFAPREVIAGGTDDPVLQEDMVVAWNPSASGWKVEDVALVSASGAHPLGQPGEGWPAHDVGGVTRPGVLEI